jgi:radical SAM family protein
MRFLLDKPGNADDTDTWSKRALGGIKANLALLRSREGYSNIDRYKRAVMDVNRLLHNIGQKGGVQLSLSNYTSPDLSPVRSSDLMKAAERFEENPFYPHFQKRLTEFFCDQEPDITGFSVNFMSQALCAFAMAGFIRKNFSGTRIVFGGGLVTSWMQVPGFNNPFFGLLDDLVPGAGEAALLSMCGKAIVSESKFFGYAYTHLTTGKYLAPGLILPYSTSRGCYWQKCKFCPEKSEQGGYQPMDIADVMEDIHGLVRQTDPCLIHFLDNALSPRFLKHLIHHPPGVPWYGFARITRHLADPDFVRSLKASGCVMLKLGIESGDQAVLDSLEKGIDIETVSKALWTLKNAAISTYGYLLFGTPAETEASAKKTLAFAIAHADAIDFLNLAVFNLPACSEDAKKFVTSEFYQGDLSLYREFEHPKGWNRDRVRRFLAKEFKHHPAIRSILNNEPPFFTSNHAPLFVM